MSRAPPTYTQQGDDDMPMTRASLLALALAASLASRAGAATLACPRGAAPLLEQTEYWRTTHPQIPDKTESRSAWLICTNGHVLGSTLSAEPGAAPGGITLVIRRTWFGANARKNTFTMSSHFTPGTARCSLDLVDLIDIVDHVIRSARQGTGSERVTIDH
jgi:hypothetical protein